MQRRYFRSIGLLLILLRFLAAGCPVMAQDISQIAKSDPLIISGAVGTNNTYYHSSMGSGYATPFNSTFYANLNISIYGFNMPFSVYYASNNFSFTHPYFTFNTSPSYKNWTLHFGESSMSYSNYVMSMPFNGLGVEYNGKKFRFGAFYGTLKKAINDDPTDPMARKPQYERIGWGGKVGVGTSNTYLDVYFLRVQDRLSSLYDAWHETLPAQEDVVLGVKGRFGLGRFFSLQGNIAGTAFSDDIQSPTFDYPEFTRWDKIFTARYSSLARVAGDVSANFTFKGFNTSVYYKMIQPDYKSLGVSYMSNNMQALGISASTSLFGRVSLSGNFSSQQDNISKQQMYTTEGYVYSAGLGASLGSHCNLSLGYSGYRQMQTDGSVVVPDSIRADRVMNSFYFTPSFNFGNRHITHALSPSVNYTMNGDLNPYTNKGGVSDVHTMAAGLGYALTFNDIETTVSSNYSHQQSKGYGTQYVTDLVSLGTSRSFLADKNLDASVNVNFISNRVADQNSNLSVGFDASASYTLKEAHVFSFSAAFNRYNNINFTENLDNIGTPTVYDGYDLSVSLSYCYTFTLLQIKKRAEEKDLK